MAEKRWKWIGDQATEKYACLQVIIVYSIRQVLTYIEE
jgi:hypothetical protein